MSWPAPWPVADDQISVVVPPIGGGFGGKCWGENGLFAVAAQLALRLSRPLRLVQSRPENLLSMQARDQDQRITLAANSNGVVTAMECRSERRRGRLRREGRVRAAANPAAAPRPLSN